MTAPRSTDQDHLLLVPRDQLKACGMSDAQVDTALACPPRFCTFPDTAGAVFDVDRVKRVLAVFARLRHTKTQKFGGQPLVPDPWQVAWVIAPTFGWVDDQGLRLVRELYIEVPRKNGKSTIATGLALYLLSADREPGAEVYAAAVDRKQASRIIEDAKAMVRASPDLAARALPLAGVVKYPSTGGVMLALSRVAEAAHGLNVSGGIIDELHVHKNRDLVDAIRSGTGARSQPLVILITTADEGGAHTIYDEYRGRVENGHHGIAEFTQFAGLVWAAPDEADPFDEQVIRAANPSWGTALNPDVVAGEIETAQQNPASLAAYKRLRLNIRSKSAAGLFNMADWQACAHESLPDLGGRECFGGFDLSSVSDFTAAALVFPPLYDGEPHWVRYHCWLPEDQVDTIERVCKVPINQWVRDGYITLTEGNVVDYEPLKQWFVDARDRYQLRWVGFDPWNTGDLDQRLRSEGIRIEPVRQGLASLSQPTKRLDRLVRSGELGHLGDPCLSWQASCLTVRKDATDNIRPVKPDRDRESKRIDAMVSIITALFGVIRHGTKRSVYEARAVSQEVGSDDVFDALF